MVCRVIAHRGASHDHPENTLDAFAGARDQGADWVELDVRRTVDGSLVVHHDPSLPDGRLLVELSRAELPQGVPGLAEALEACVPMGVNVEIKNVVGEPDFDEARSVVGPLVELVRSSPVEVLVSSFDAAAIDACRTRAGDLATGYLVWDPDSPLDAVAWAAERGHRALHPWHALVDQRLVARCHSVGLEVNVWTVDDPARIAELAHWGVDGVVTNRPAVALDALGRRP